MKTHLLTKKRALISSVAMLLVAMIALGTATFAWFTSNPTASASGLKIKATAKKGLVIQTSSHKNFDPTFWGHTDYFNAYKNAEGNVETRPEAVSLSATSFSASDFTKAYTVDAKADDSYVADDNALVESTVTGYYQETVNCKLLGGDSEDDTDTVVVTSLGITPNGDKKLTNCIRVNLQYTYKGVTTDLGTYAVTKKSNKVLTKIGKYSEALSKAASTFEANTTVSNMDAGTVDAKGTGYFTMTAYLDGEDANCTTDNIDLSTLVDSITLNLELKSAID